MDETNTNKVLNQIMQDEKNQNCIDCGSSSPCWVSCNNAVLVCIKCAGIHRSLGKNFSDIKKLDADTL